MATTTTKKRAKDVEADAPAQAPAKPAAPARAAARGKPTAAGAAKAASQTKSAARAPRRTKAAGENGDGQGNGAANREAVDSLLTKGRDEGFITHDQILEAVPQPEQNLGAIEELYAAAEEEGVEVLDAQNNPTFAEVEEEDARGWKPTVVFVDEHNRIQATRKELAGPRRRIRKAS